MVDQAPRSNGAPVSATGAQVVRAFPTPALLVDRERQITAANAALARLLGRDPSTSLEGHADRLVIPEERSALRDVLLGSRDSLAGAEQQVMTMVRADGAAVRTRWRVLDVVQSGELLVLIEAVTDERQARDDAPTSNRLPADFLLRVFDAIPDPALLYLELDKTILDVNEPWCARTGYARAEVRGARLDQLDIWHDPEERVAFHERLMRQGSVHEFVMRFRRRGDSEVRDAVVSAQIIRQQGREVALVVARDVTAEREVEEKLRHAQRLEALGRLASGVAHDYNNVLSIIGGYGQELRQSLGADDPRQRDVAEILHAVRRAAGLTRQLLAFGRRSIQEPRLLDLNAVTEELRPLLARLVGSRIRLRIARAPAPALVLADPTAIQQVLVNLAANARDAMPAGGRLVIALSLVVDHHARSRAGPGAVPSGVHVQLAVRDTGAGMDERTRARLFEPYFTTKGADQGSGLGLSTVYGIVTQSGGHIDVDTAPGRGTTFRIHLPAVSDTAAAVSGTARR